MMRKCFSSLFGTWHREIRLTLRERIVSPEIINLNFGGKNTLHCYSVSHYHLIHLADIQRSYLICFQVCNILKILRKENHFKHCIFHCRMLHSVIPYSFFKMFCGMLHLVIPYSFFEMFGLSSGSSLSHLSESTN